MREHAQVPSNPKAGDKFACGCCDYTAEFVVLDDGRPGEWVDTTAPADPSRGGGDGA